MTRTSLEGVHPPSQVGLARTKDPAETTSRPRAGSLDPHTPDVVKGEDKLTRGCCAQPEPAESAVRPAKSSEQRLDPHFLSSGPLRPP